MTDALRRVVVAICVLLTTLAQPAAVYAAWPIYSALNQSARAFAPPTHLVQRRGGGGGGYRYTPPAPQYQAPRYSPPQQRYVPPASTPQPRAAPSYQSSPPAMQRAQPLPNTGRFGAGTAPWRGSGGSGFAGGIQPRAGASPGAPFGLYNALGRPGQSGIYQRIYGNAGGGQQRPWFYRAERLANPVPRFERTMTASARSTAPVTQTGRVQMSRAAIASVAVLSGTAAYAAASARPPAPVEKVSVQLRSSRLPNDKPLPFRSIAAMGNGGRVGLPAGSGPTAIYTDKVASLIHQRFTASYGRAANLSADEKARYQAQSRNSSAQGGSRPYNIAFGPSPRLLRLFGPGAQVRNLQALANSKKPMQIDGNARIVQGNSSISRPNNLYFVRQRRALSGSKAPTLIFNKGEIIYAGALTAMGSAARLQLRRPLPIGPSATDAGMSDGRRRIGSLSAGTTSAGLKNVILRKDTRGSENLRTNALGYGRGGSKIGLRTVGAVTISGLPAAPNRRSNQKGSIGINKFSAVNNTDFRYQKSDSLAFSSSRSIANTNLKPEYTFANVADMRKNSRTDPRFYFSQKQLNEHKKLFEDGGGFYLTSKDISDPAFKEFPKDKYIMPKFEMARVEAEFKKTGDRVKLAQALGFENNHFIGQKIYKVEIDKPIVTMPSGNEPGANKYWGPGGQTSGHAIEGALVNFDLKHNNDISYLTKSPYFKGSID